MEYLLSASQAKKLDDYTINECGLMAEVLMERAALSVADVITAKQPVNQRDIKKVLVVCGSGNNGADGICTARILSDRGYKVVLSLVGNEEKATTLYKSHKAIAAKWGIEFYNIIPNDEYDVIVDAIFGIGLSRCVEGKYLETINKINSIKNAMKAKEKVCEVYAVDIPSGICADSGLILGAAVKADYTVTFGYRKTGHMMYPGKDYSGQITVADVGFCSLKQAGIECEAFTYNMDDLHNILPERNPAANKGNFGRMLIIAGSKNMAGAAVLCAKAAIKAGAGLVKIFTCESNRVIVQTSVPEALISTYKDEWSNHIEDIAEFKSLLVKELSWANVIVIGPGITTNDSAKEMLKYTLKYITCPILLDADALNIISEDDTISIPDKAVITPHLKEMSRLCKKTVTQIKDNVIGTAIEFANNNDVKVVLKDAKTVVTDGEKVYINSSGNDGLATGGSGDVLAGIIGSFMAQGQDKLQSCMSGVYVHGYVADCYAKKHNRFSLTPTDLIEELSNI